MSLDGYLRAAPKAELHVHLEGAIDPATLLRLAARNGVALPATTEAGLRALCAAPYRDFAHFVGLFVAACRCLRTAEDYAEVVYEFGRELARQNCRYAEVTFSPSTHHILGVPHDVYCSGLTRGRARALADFGVEINWIFNIVRRWDDPARTVPMADYATGAAIEGQDDGVVALGLGGTEVGGPPEPFATWFDRARAAGLHSAPHAGETAGPESVWGALRALGAERIGHGVRAIEDPALVAELAARGVPLEISPTSNVRLGVYPDYAAHPLPRLRAAGVAVTVNSDDPPLFATTLSDEVALLAGAFGLDVAACDEILLAAVRHSFLPAERRAALEAAFRTELAELKRIHLADA
ncbi:MAG TPA: adenosine deaminase [Thermomicrobiales bacterium]|nr:adenosine deaminase [Thermomicrobiales bacterium]